MSLTPREAFKFGFLSRCVESGLSLEEIQQQAKQAADKLAGWLPDFSAPVSAGWGALKGVSGKALAIGIPTALAAPPILGGLAGYGLSRAMDVNERDVDEVKRDELVDEYRRQTDLLRRAKAIRDARKTHKHPGRPLL
jgi:hypothetical protein